MAVRNADDAADNFIDYYKVLGLSWHANAGEIEEAYKKLDAVCLDADRKVLRDAYDVLCNNKKRISYNEQYLKNKIAGDYGNAEVTAAGEKTFLTPQQQELDVMVNSTRTYFAEFDDYVKQQLSNTDKDLEFKGDAADRAEALYKQGMWPFLGKIKEFAGEDGFAYVAACELHSRAVFSLGDLCMWAERYERAIGMYNTALALSSKNKEQAERCDKAIKFARDVIEDVKIKSLRLTKKEKERPPAAPVVFSFMEVVKWVFIGVMFASACLWGVILFLEFIFTV